MREVNFVVNRVHIAPLSLTSEVDTIVITPSGDSTIARRTEGSPLYCARGVLTSVIVVTEIKSHRDSP